ncbi:MAG: aminomethyl-transferring glycine dehydrogenase subunit GcvPB [candidate division WOR-3 bacterium]
MPEALIFELSRPGRKGYSLKGLDVPRKGLSEIIPDKLLRKTPAPLPEVSENEIVRHYHRLSAMNYHVDRGFYPLGSCTMKYNPKINERVSRLPGFAGLHPLAPDETVQGALRLMWELAEYLRELSGMHAVHLQPSAGAQGEFTGVMIIRRYHEEKGDPREIILMPDSAHGTNPASSILAGYKTMAVKSAEDGTISIEDLKSKLNDRVAAIMITNPNTLGLFERNIKEVSELMHKAGALVYMDGANLNAALGYIKTAEMGVDVMHFNLHKTFSTPHGGGGPGSGPVGVVKELEPYLPVPRVMKEGERFYLSWNFPKSIGKVHSFYGNFNVFLKAYAFIRMAGADGIKRMSEDAVINANYIRVGLDGVYDLHYPGVCTHEVVFAATNLLRDYGIKTLDVAKRLLDLGFHAPTVYFPLIVHEALMIEPTENESKETLDAFIAAMKRIAQEAKENPELLKKAPTSAPVRRLDEVKAAKDLNVKWVPEAMEKPKEQGA